MTSPFSGGAPASQARTGRSPVAVALLGLLACAASLALYALPIARPTLIVDDFQIVFRSWTWEKAWANLWVPANEHVMPLGRITTAGLAALAGGRPTVFLSLSGWHGPLALVLGMILVGIFLSRERGHAFYGLLAMTLFGVSTIYRNAVFWFSASFSVFAMDTFLLALLAAQQFVRTGRRRWLVLCVLGCALAPGWFAIGILAGPFCSIYLLLAASERDGGDSTGSGGFRHPRAVALLWAAMPILGSLAFLALIFSLPRTAETIMHLPHYDGDTAIQAFDPVTGAFWACRSVVDNLAWSLLGVSQLTCPTPWVWIPFALLVALAAWWVWQAPRRTAAILGLCIIGISYWLMYSARARWGYEVAAMNWSRYHLFPQLGLAFVLAGGLPSAARSADAGRVQELSWWQGWALVLLIGALFLTQLPRGVLSHITFRQKDEPSNDEYVYQLPFGWQLYLARSDGCAEQREAMRRIEAVDALCRKHHISAAVAQRVLRPIIMWNDCSGPPQNESNWQFLNGSDEPREISDEEAKRLLQPAMDK